MLRRSALRAGGVGGGGAPALRVEPHVVGATLLFDDGPSRAALQQFYAAVFPYELCGNVAPGRRLKKVDATVMTALRSGQGRRVMAGSVFGGSGGDDERRANPFTSLFASRSGNTAKGSGGGGKDAQKGGKAAAMWVPAVAMRQERYHEMMRHTGDGLTVLSDISSDFRDPSGTALCATGRAKGAEALPFLYAEVEANAPLHTDPHRAPFRGAADANQCGAVAWTEMLVPGPAAVRPTAWMLRRVLNWQPRRPVLFPGVSSEYVPHGNTSGGRQNSHLVGGTSSKHLFVPLTGVSLPAPAFPLVFFGCGEGEASLETRLAAVPKHGGAVHRPPFKHPTIGGALVAVCADPLGAPFGLIHRPPVSWDRVDASTQLLPGHAESEVLEADVLDLSSVAPADATGTSQLPSKGTPAAALPGATPKSASAWF